MSSPAPTQESSHGGYTRKNCACCGMGFTHEGALPTPHLLSKFTQALLKETCSSSLSSLRLWNTYSSLSSPKRWQTDYHTLPTFFSNCPPSSSHRVLAPGCCWELLSDKLRASSECPDLHISLSKSTCDFKRFRKARNSPSKSTGPVLLIFLSSFSRIHT